MKSEMNIDVSGRNGTGQQVAVIGKAEMTDSIWLD